MDLGQMRLQMRLGKMLKALSNLKIHQNLFKFCLLYDILPWISLQSENFYEYQMSYFFVSIWLNFSFDKTKVLCLMLHSCDVSHPAKRWGLHHRWTARCMEEFFVQGDREKELGLEYSPLCDRHNTMVPQSQIGE